MSRPILFHIAAAAVIVCSIGCGSAPEPTAKKVKPTETRTRLIFDRALISGDADTLKSTLRTKEVGKLDHKQMVKFIEVVIQPWMKSDSPVVGAEGKLMAWNDPMNPMVVSFRLKGGADLLMPQEGKDRTFRTPLTKEGEEFKSTVTLCQLIFTAAFSMANSPDRDMVEEQEYGQKLAEEWIAKLKVAGIEGSIDPADQQYKKWDVILSDSRKSIEELKAEFAKNGKKPPNHQSGAIGTDGRLNIEQGPPPSFSGSKELAGVSL